MLSFETPINCSHSKYLEFLLDKNTTFSIFIFVQGVKYFLKMPEVYLEPSQTMILFANSVNSSRGILRTEPKI